MTIVTIMMITMMTEETKAMEEIRITEAAAMPAAEVIPGTAIPAVRMWMWNGRAIYCRLCRKLVV